MTWIKAFRSSRRVETEAGRPRLIPRLNAPRAGCLRPNMRNHSAVPAKEIGAEPENGEYDGRSPHLERCACAAPIRLDRVRVDLSGGSNSATNGTQRNRQYAEQSKPCSE